VVQALGAGQIEECLVDRQRLDQRGQRQHPRSDLAADGAVFFHVGWDHHGFRAQFERLEHRHRRAHALDAGDVAGGGDDAAPAATDDQRPVAQGRVVALFDRGVEGVAIDMGDVQPVEFWMGEETRAAAGRAPCRARVGVAKAVAAERRAVLSARSTHMCSAHM